MTDNVKSSHEVDPGPSILRVATYNIHKGVQGMGPVRRLEIHNLGHAVEQLDADIELLHSVSQVVDFQAAHGTDRKSTRLNSSHVRISYAVFCLKKKKHPRAATLSRT